MPRPKLCYDDTVMETGSKALSTKTLIIVAVIVAVLVAAALIAVVILSNQDEPATSSTPDNTEEQTADGAPDEAQAAGVTEATECISDISQLGNVEILITCLSKSDASQADKEAVWHTFLSKHEVARNECWETGVESPFTLADMQAVFSEAGFDIENLDEADTTRAEVDKLKQVLDDKMLAYIDGGGSEACVQYFASLLTAPALQRNSRNAQRRNDIGNLVDQTIIWQSNNNANPPEGENEWQRIVDALGWGWYGGDESSPALEIAKPTDPSGQFKIYVITNLDYADQDELDAALTDFYLPGWQEIHVWLGAECQSKKLAGGNDKDQTTAANNKYDSGYMLVAPRRVTAYVYQLEGKESAHCEDH